MREVAFIRKNKTKWLETERVVSGKIKINPDDLSSLYIQLLNDLSFAQTYYPESKTTLYLNQLTTQIYQKIYKTKRVEQNRLKYFFVTEVPLLVYQYHKYFVFTIFMFVLLTFFGGVSVHYDEDFVRLILGDSYVDMTLENINQGNPIAVYDSGSNWGVSIAVTFNNLIVGARMYFFGVFLGIGTLYILLKNAIMLGSFQYFFHTQGVLAESMQGIWIHGAFEISGMVVEAAAGFILGAHILFPKTYTRLQSFKIGFKNSFKIFLSTIPFTIIAGFFEGFVTRHALNMPKVVAFLIIFCSFGIIVFYYGIYPIWVYRKKNKSIVSISEIV